MWELLNRGIFARVRLSVFEETMKNDVMHLLVVDDEDRIRRLLKMYLERENYVISEADNGEDALKMVLENDYDLVLLDLMLPKMDGIEVAEKIRESKTTPIMMLTAGTWNKAYERGSKFVRFRLI